MPKTRHEVAYSVATKFLPAKKAVTLAAAASYDCLATMLSERDRAEMGPEFGADILRLAKESADAAFQAVERAHQVHGRLAEIRAEWAIPPSAYGPDDTVKNRLNPSEALKLVSAA